MATWIISGCLGFIAGGAFIWFCKERIQQIVIGANALSAKLRAKADALSSTLKNS